jgi:hypothetical protein
LFLFIIYLKLEKGIMKLVGEAVADELHEYDTNLTVLGIATWGVIKDKNFLINPVNL